MPSEISPFRPAQVAAALHSGWPRLQVFADHEAAIAELLPRLEAALGPLPQADVIEPWGPGEWALRVDLPDLGAEGMGLAEAVIGEMDHVWEVGRSLGVTQAEDLGASWTEWLDGGGLAAGMCLEVEGGGLPLLDLLRREEIDAELAQLERRLCHALQAQDPRLRLRSDRGEDTLCPVVHRSTGRVGVELVLPSEVFEGLDGDEVLALRQRALAAVAEVVLAAQGERVQLAPDPAWTLRLGGLVLWVWLVVPSVPSLPGGARVKEGLTHARGPLEGFCEEVEIQVVPRRAEDHDRVVAQVVALERLGGGPPRWLRVEEGWRFTPTWRGELQVSVSQLLSLQGVYGVRVVPGAPSGLEALWATVDPHVHVGTQRVAVRLRDGVMDRDHLERIEDRAMSPWDQQVLVPWMTALGELVRFVEAQGPLPVRPVVDRRGRVGLELRFGPVSLVEAAARQILEITTSFPQDQVAGWVTWAYQRAGLLLRVWGLTAEEGPRVWRELRRVGVSLPGGGA